MKIPPNKNISREFKLRNAVASEYKSRDTKSAPDALAITDAISSYLMIYWYEGKITLTA